MILSVVAFIAGHPTQVMCDADVNPGPVVPAPGFVVTAWTLIGTGPVHMTPALCDNTRAPIGSSRFAEALSVAVREASIAGAVRSEACASLIEVLGVYDVLRRFYGIPFFSPLSWQIGAAALADVRAGPQVNYQPEACRWPG